MEDVINQIGPWLKTLDPMLVVVFLGVMLVARSRTKPKPADPPKAVQAPTTPVVPTEGFFQGRGLLTTLARAKAVEILVKEKGLSPDQAQAAVDKVSDTHVVLFGGEIGALGDGRVLARIRDVIDWLTSEEGKAKLLALAKLIAMIAAALAMV